MLALALLSYGALFTLLGVLLRLGRQRQQGWWGSATFTAGLFTLYTFSASGHPNSLEPATLWIAVDLVHLGAITVWIGGLFAIAVAGRAALSEPDGIRMARRFSTAAAICVPVSYTHLRAHETVLDLVCRLLLEKKKQLLSPAC
mgnify:CR=1 FL=1